MASGLPPLAKSESAGCRRFRDDHTARGLFQMQHRFSGPDRNSTDGDKSGDDRKRLRSKQPSLFNKNRDIVNLTKRLRLASNLAVDEMGKTGAPMAGNPRDNSPTKSSKADSRDEVLSDAPRRTESASEDMTDSSQLSGHDIIAVDHGNHRLQRTCTFSSLENNLHQLTRRKRSTKVLHQVHRRLGPTAWSNWAESAGEGHEPSTGMNEPKAGSTRYNHTDGNMEEAARAFAKLQSAEERDTCQGPEVRFVFDASAKLAVLNQLKRMEECTIIVYTMDMAPSRDAFIEWLQEELIPKARVCVRHVQDKRYYLVVLANETDKKSSILCRTILHEKKNGFRPPMGT